MTTITVTADELEAIRAAVHHLDAAQERFHGAYRAQVRAHADSLHALVGRIERQAAA